MEKLIKEVFEKKLSDGTIEKIVSEKIEEMVSKIIEEQMGWRGEVRELLTEKLKPVMLQAVKNCDLSKTAIVVTEFLNNSFNKTPVHLMKDTFEGLQSLFSTNELIASVKFGDKIKLSEVFKNYVKYVKMQAPTSMSELKDLGFYIDYGDQYVEIPCSMEIELDEDPAYRNQGTNYTVELQSALDEEKTIKFRLVRNYKDELTIRMDGRFPELAEFAYMDAFIMYLFTLQNYWVSIDFDTHFSEDAEAEIEISEE